MILFSRKEPPLEIFFRFLGSGFYFAYVGYQIFLKIQEYQNFPGTISISSWMNWVLVMGLFLLFGVSYLVRAAPISAAKRPHEIIFPLICAVMPFGINESVRWVKPYAVESWSEVAVVLILLGDVISVLAMVYLRNSFSIMTEAREFVRRGLYRWVRHPLYLGESLATIGFCIYLFSWLNLILTLIFLISLRLRASFEEEKLLSVFPEYKEYKKNTGMFLPRL